MKTLLVIWFVSSHGGGMTSEIVTIKECQKIQEFYNGDVRKKVDCIALTQEQTKELDK